MKTPFHKASLLAAVAVAAIAFAPSMAQAQTEPVTATVEVLNALTITEVDPLDFGIVAAINDPVLVATLSIDAATGTLATVNNAPAVFAVVDNTTATRAQITIEDGAVGALLNFEINNVTNPTFGGNSFNLTGWETNYNAGAVTARAVATPFSYNFAGPIDTLNIGAEIRTIPSALPYTDGIYPGSFDVVVSY